MKKSTKVIIIILLFVNVILMWFIFYLLGKNNNKFDGYMENQSGSYADTLPIESITDYDYTITEYISSSLESQGYLVDMVAFDPDNYVHNSYNQVSYVLQSDVGDLSVIINYDKYGNFEECIIEIIEGDPEE